MEHRDDLQALAAHSVRNDVPCAWHDELTSAGYPTGPPQIGNSAKRSTAASNVVAVRVAAPGFSRAI